MYRKPNRQQLIDIANDGVAWLDYNAGRKIKYSGGFDFLKEPDGSIFVYSQYQGDWVRLV